MSTAPHTPPPKPASTGAVVLSTVKVISMIKEKLHLQETYTTELEKQLKNYFTKVGIETESTLAVMKERSHWPLLSDLAVTANDTNLIKTPILLTLCEIAEFVGRIHASNCFLGLRVTYKSLSKWASANENPGRYDAQSPSHSTTRGQQVGKVPSFTVPPYEGVALQGNVYISTCQMPIIAI